MDLTLCRLGSAAEVITLHNAVANLPCPSLGTEGVSVAAWCNYVNTTPPYSPANALITISASAQTTLDNPLALYGIADGEAHWIGTLNGGAPIRIANNKTPCSFEVSTGGFQQLAVGGEYGVNVACSGGALLTVKARPIYLLG